nr:MAG TPA: hypothetical protein [Caudoviricetes sp.]
MKNKKQHTEQHTDQHTEQHTETSKFCCVYLLTM